MSICIRAAQWGNEWYALDSESDLQLGTKCGMQCYRQYHELIEESNREPDCPECREAIGLDPENSED